MTWTSFIFDIHFSHERKCEPPFRERLPQQRWEQYSFCESRPSLSRPRESSDDGEPSTLPLVWCCSFLPTFAPLPSPLVGAAVIAAFLLGVGVAHGRGRASEGSTSITGIHLTSIFSWQGTGAYLRWETKKPGYNIHSGGSPTFGGTPTSRSYILAFLSGVVTRIAQRYKLNSGDREFRFVSPTSIRIIHALLQFVNRWNILFPTFSIF